MVRRKRLDFMSIWECRFPPTILRFNCGDVRGEWWSCRPDQVPAGLIYLMLPRVMAALDLESEQSAYEPRWKFSFCRVAW
jgi:hypothetical protein